MRSSYRSRMGWAAVLAVAMAACAGPPSSPRLTVFAASSLTDVMEAVADAWEIRGGSPIAFSFAASSTLARQADAGAPADVVVLASADWMQWLVDRGVVDAATRVRPFSNRLALVAPVGGADSTAFDPAFRLADGARVAVGDPDHVPAGQYTRQVLERIGRWDELEPRLAIADNVRGAVALVEREDVPLGFVYRTDAAVSDRVRVIGLVPDSLHAPIVYEAAAVAGQSGRDVAAFLDFLASPEGQRLFRDAGFVVSPS